VVDSIVDSVDVTVLNGPTEIQLDVDFGRPGVRGSQIYIVSGDPNDSSTVVPVTVRYNDLAINNSKAVPQDYLNVYQYISSGGVDLWEKVLRITTDFYSYSATKVFTNGVTSVNIPVSAIVGTEVAATVESSNFNIQCTIAGSEIPAAVSVKVGEIVEQDEEFILPITINAAEFDESVWNLINDSKTVHLFITVV
jgi:hypothetical protein